MVLIPWNTRQWQRRVPSLKGARLLRLVRRIRKRRQQANTLSSHPETTAVPLVFAQWNAEGLWKKKPELQYTGPERRVIMWATFVIYIWSVESLDIDLCLSLVCFCILWVAVWDRIKCQGIGFSYLRLRQKKAFSFRGLCPLTPTKASLDPTRGLLRHTVSV